jgi:hypothetical protein
MSDANKSSVDARLNKLGAAIAAFRSKLELHGMFDEGHKITEKALKDRLQEVESEVQSRTVSGDQASDKASWLEHEMEKWVSSTDLDFKP